MTNAPNITWNTNVPIQTECRVIRPQQKHIKYPEPIDVDVIKQCCGGDMIILTMNTSLYNDLEGSNNCSYCGLHDDICKCHDPVLCLNCKGPMLRCKCPDY